MLRGRRTSSIPMHEHQVFQQILEQQHLNISISISFGNDSGIKPIFLRLQSHQGLGVGDIIEKIIDSRYIGIFTTYRQVIVIEKNRFGNYRKIIVIENVHLISSDKHCSKNKSERVFHILNEYEFVLENSAKS